jgi:hypothetical protein
VRFGFEMVQSTQTRNTTSPGCLGAGGPVWYAMLALSLLSCSLNPVGAAGLAMRILTPHDMYSKLVGWLLTAGSFVIAMSGFIATERIAYLERSRRALEFASLLACGAGLLAFALGFTLPAYIMWPIAALLVLIGASGFRGTTGLPVPGIPGTGAALGAPAASRTAMTAMDEQIARTSGDSLSGTTKPGLTPGGKRRRRRHRKKPPATSRRPRDNSSSE